METTEADPHMAWFEEWKAARAKWCKAATGHNHEWDMPTVNAMEAEQERLAALIGQTVAKTREGMLAQIEYWIADWGDNRPEPEPHDAVLYSIRSTLKEELAA